MLVLVHNWSSSADSLLERGLRWMLLAVCPMRRAPDWRRAVRWMPHLLSLARPALGLLIWWLLVADMGTWLVAATFALAIITDRLDGTWARLYGSESKFGQALDPLCDKFFLLILLLPLWPLIPALILWPLVVLELALILVPLWVWLGPSPYLTHRVKANRWGKIKFVLECVGLACLLVFGSTGALVANIILALAVVFAALSLAGKIMARA